jgi:hypothetical protein
MSQRYTAYTNVTCPTFALDPSSGWSVCGWLYIVASIGGDGDLFFVQPILTPGSAYAIRLGYSHNGSDPTLRFRCGDGTDQLNHTEVVTTGQWYNLAITYDGTTARAYVDGVEVASQTMTMSGSYDQMDMGDFAFGTATVELAQIKVWEGHALSPSELATEIAYWTPQTAPGDVYAWWQQEAVAPTADSSGNGQTLSGPGTTDGSFTPPGQLNPTNPNVAAIGGTTSDGVAVVREKLRIQAAGNTVAGSYAFVRTNVAPEGGGATSFGGRSRKRRSRR